MEQLILHLISDYVLQSQWMADNKTKCSKAAALHAVVYSLPFLLLQPSVWAFAVILGTHFLIDRYRLAARVVWLKNVLMQPMSSVWRDGFLIASKSKVRGEAASDDGDGVWLKRWSWANCKGTGYPSDMPPWLSVWLLIAADNTIHLTINYAALTWL